MYDRLRIKYEECSTLESTIKLTNQLALHLARIYQRGFTVDMEALEDVRKEFEQEKEQLVFDLEAQVRDLMGDRPINLNSPEQLSWVIYSRNRKQSSVLLAMALAKHGGTKKMVHDTHVLTTALTALLVAIYLIIYLKSGD